MESKKMTVPKRPLTWLITGAGTGFGLALVRLAQSHGHMVIATSRDPSKTPDLVAEVESKSGRWMPLDVTDPNAPHIVKQLEADGIVIDVLVNNAGRSLHGVAESFRDEETRIQFETVFFGPFRLIQAVIPGMRKRRSGIVVNISTGAAVDGMQTLSIYGGAKAAMDGMARVLAKEVAPFNVRVLTVLLGAFDTGFASSRWFTKSPLPEDYKGTSPVYKFLTEGDNTFPLHGDHQKASQAIYEVVTGTGVGEGNEGERVLLLGRDMARCQQGMEEQWKQTWEVFGDICDNVQLDGHP